MTRTAALVFVGWCAIATFAQAPQRDRPAARRSGDSTVAGLVVSDETEPRPLRRARVTLSGSALSSAELAITNEDGTFEFRGLPAGRYTVSAAKQPYLSMSYGARRPMQPGTPIDVAAGETKKVNLRLARGAVITGVLTDPDGQPVVGVNVYAFKFSYLTAAGERRLIPAGTLVAPTDDNGVFRIFGLPPGEYIVGTEMRRASGALSTVSAEDVRAALAEARAPRGNTTGISSTLSPRSTVSSSPAVVMAPIYYPGTGFPAQAARVAVSAGDERAGVDFQLAPVPAATITGSLPAISSSVIVAIARRDEYLAGGATQLTRVDSLGRFSFRSVVPGRYTVTALAMNFSVPESAEEPVQWASTDITVDGQDVSVALTLQPAIGFAGRVVFEGTSGRPAGPPLTDLPLPLHSTFGAPAPRLRLEADGSFTLRGIVPGGYRVGAIAGVRAPAGRWWLKSILSGGRDLLDAPLDLRQGLTDVLVTFSDRAGELSGRITDAAGSPLPNVHVIVFSTDRHTWFSYSRTVAGTRPDADGRYTIRNLPAGRYFLAVDDNVDAYEWFEPVVLERLVPRAIQINLAQDELRTQDLLLK